MNISDLKIIAKNGGGMIIDAKKISPADLKVIALNASGTQANIIIKNPHVIHSADLKLIARTSNGCVIFDFFDI